MICRICLHITKESDTISLLTENTTTITILKLLINKFNPKIVSDAILCRKCNETIQSIWEFREMCLQNEEKVVEFVRKCESPRESVGSCDLLAIAKRIEDVKNEDESCADYTRVDSLSVIVKEEFESVDEICNEETNSVKEEQSDINHQIQVFDCTVCDMSFRSEVKLKAHIHMHSQDRPFMCEVCSKTFTQKRYLRRHLIIHTGAKPFVCELCDKGFAHKSTLHKHVNYHTGLRPHKCNVCDKDFTERRQRDTHMMTQHYNSKPHKCELCKRAFVWRTDLKKHACTGEKDFVCAVCARGFVGKRGLEEHMKLHSDEKPFECDVCKKRFNRKKDLKMHVRMHSDVKSYECERCGKFFKLKGHLNAHLKRHDRQQSKELGLI